MGAAMAAATTAWKGSMVLAMAEEVIDRTNACRKSRAQSQAGSIRSSHVEAMRPQACARNDPSRCCGRVGGTAPRCSSRKSTAHGRPPSQCSGRVAHVVVRAARAARAAAVAAKVGVAVEVGATAAVAEEAEKMGRGVVAVPSEAVVATPDAEASTGRADKRSTWPGRWTIWERWGPAQASSIGATSDP